MAGGSTSGNGSSQVSESTYAGRMGGQILKAEGPAFHRASGEGQSNIGFPLIRPSETPDYTIDAESVAWK